MSRPLAPRRAAALPLLPLLLAGCIVGPDYEAPEPPVDHRWIDPGLAAEAPPAAWWRRFDDPALEALVAQGLEANLDLAAAGERIVRARVAVAAAGAGARPSADAGGSASRQRQSETGPLPAGRIPQIPTYQTVYDVGVDARWELDLFGRTRRAVEAARASVDAAVERRRDLEVTLTAEIARRYFQLRGAQLELAAEEAGLAAAERTLALVERRHAAGDVARDAVRRAEAELAVEGARLPSLRARRDAALLSLGVLTGSAPGTHRELLAAPAALPTLEAVPVGTPAELLRRRPDVRGAERNLAAATASVGVARGALYPRLTLGAAAGFVTLESGELLDPASRRWSLAPILAWRILDDGRLRAEIAVAESRQREAALAYEQAVLEALTDAEQALHAYGHARAGIAARAAALAALAASRRVVAARYRAGAVPLVALLDADRRLSEARAGLARTRVEGTTALVALYKALGGGWQGVAGTGDPRTRAHATTGAGTVRDAGSAARARGEGEG